VDTTISREYMSLLKVEKCLRTRDALLCYRKRSKKIGMSSAGPTTPSLQSQGSTNLLKKWLHWPKEQLEQGLPFLKSQAATANSKQ
jgi:hypothetical protein